MHQSWRLLHVHVQPHKLASFRDAQAHHYVSNGTQNIFGFFSLAPSLSTGHMEYPSAANSALMFTVLCEPQSTINHSYPILHRNITVWPAPHSTTRCERATQWQEYSLFAYSRFAYSHFDYFRQKGGVLKEEEYHSVNSHQRVAYLHCIGGVESNQDSSKTPEGEGTQPSIHTGSIHGAEVHMGLVRLCDISMYEFKAGTIN